jgi:hypothetical protein
MIERATSESAPEWRCGSIERRQLKHVLLPHLSQRTSNFFELVCSHALSLAPCLMHQSVIGTMKPL